MAIREAKTKYGTYVGEPSGITTVTVFKGIPYAKPPVGGLRWKDPQPLDVPSNPDSLEPIHADRFAKCAVQYMFSETDPANKEGYTAIAPIGEDCLYLNIWTPAQSPDDKLPVMFWIHGGGFIGGGSFSSFICGEQIGKRGVVLVSIAYRLGIFGFLAHPELTAEGERKSSGNYGTLDQVAALKWVHENISGFGGDPDNITVFGQSAGAESTQLLCSSSLSKKFVNRAIMESGPSMLHNDLLDIMSLGDAEKFGSDLIRAMGFTSIEEARNVDAESIQATCGKAMFEVLKLTNPFVLTPIVDGYVVEEHPGLTAAKGNISDIEYIVGHTDEGGLDMKMKLDAYEPWLESYGEIKQELENALSVKTQEDLDKVNPDGSRGRLITSCHAFCETRCKNSGKPSYYYYFARPLPGDDAGAAHTAEVYYVFNCLNNNWRPYIGADYELANAMIGYWTDFAKNGNPNGEGRPEWEPYNPDSPRRMEFMDAPEMKDVEIPRWQRLLIDLAK
ncbi:MAG: carboxylesterase/lipase family protein [Coriobacteriales bacterium]